MLRAPRLRSLPTLLAALGVACAGVRAPPQRTDAPAPPPAPPPSVDAAAVATSSASTSATSSASTSAVRTASAAAPGERGAEPRKQDLPPSVLIIGDSLVVSGPGPSIEKALSRHAGVDRVFRRGKSSSGLARPDFFDWPSEAERLVAEHRPDFVIVLLGGNDGQDLSPRGGSEGEIAAWNGPAWEEAYRSRVHAFLDRIRAPERSILWLELPPSELPGFERKLQIIRRVQREAIDALDARGRIVFVETRRHFVDEEGEILREVKVRGLRRKQKIRLDDGIHFTLPGGRFFADRLCPDLLRLLGVESRCA